MDIPQFIHSFFSEVPVPFCILTSSKWRLPITLHHCQYLVLSVFFFNFTHSNGCIMVSPCCFNSQYLFIFETQKDRAWAGEGQRGRETQNPKQALGSELSAQSPMRGSNSRTARSWPEPKSDAQLTEPPRRPSSSFIFNCQKLEARCPSVGEWINKL